MILEALEHAGHHGWLQRGMQEAISYIVNNKEAFDLIADGRTAVGTGQLACIKVDGIGHGLEGAVLEGHRKYIDVQYTVEGSDVIGWKSAEKSDFTASSGYDAERDIEFFPYAQAVTWVTVPAGYAAVFFPEDLHAPMSCDGPVKKIVIKVPVGDRP